MKLTRTERWILSNQYKILGALFPEEADDYRRDRDAIDSGYELEYERIIPYIYEDGLSEDQCREVTDIMTMFSSLKASHDALQDKSGINTSRMSFRGFSGNDETSQMAYAQYLRDKGSFPDITHASDLNSHFPALDGYRKMLSEWRNSENPYDLSKDDIIRVTSVK